MKHTISALVENKFGVLAHVAGLFSARGFNIDSLAVGKTDDPEISRMTIVVDADDLTLEQVKKQLNKLINIISVHDITKRNFIDRELMLIKVSINKKNRQQVLEIAETLEAKTVHVGMKTISLQIVGSLDKIETAIKLLKPFGIKEVVRTGRIAMAEE